MVGGCAVAPLPFFFLASSTPPLQQQHRRQLLYLVQYSSLDLAHVQHTCNGNGLRADLDEDPDT